MSPPEKHVTLAYAAGASLAAVTLIYVFAPTWFHDSENASAKDRRKGVVGLANPANDCFINSILQALAGLEDLRAYLSQRTIAAKKRGELRGDEHGLTIDQKPFLTAALKEILDSLNERPIYRKTISNQPFLIVLERVFKQKISRTQQDAHEFLQVVTETLAEEHHKQRKLDKESESKINGKYIGDILNEDSFEEGRDGGESVVIVGPPSLEGSSQIDEQTEPEFVGMPLEGRLKSEIECQTCQFKPKPTVSTFVVLTLPVPQKSTTSLSDCIDGTLSTEYLDDFQCAKCRLQYAILMLKKKLEASTSTSKKEGIEDSISKLQHALDTDPETVPDGVTLPPVTKSRIAKRTMIQDYPDIIALHLSRSIYDTYASRKNGAKVLFSENLQMGGILDRRNYRLLCVVTHKGGHDSGHYECFRRQIVARAPFSTPTPAQSIPNTPIPSTPVNRSSTGLVEVSLLDSPVEILNPLASGSMLSPTESEQSANVPSDAKCGPIYSSSIHPSVSTEAPRLSTPTEHDKRTKTTARKLKRKRPNDRWWRISDDKIKEARTNDVLGMQKEIYLLFYQRVRDEPGNVLIPPL